MSIYSSTGISINVFDPIVLSGTEKYIDTLTDQANEYEHESRAVGGYYSARITINDKQNKIEDWLERGLGRHIIVKDNSLTTIWEGFVNQITANLGPLTYTLGPLLDIGNRVYAVYSTIDTSTSPPTLGIRAITSTSNNTASQALYGIIQKVVSLNGTTLTEANQARTLFLNENAYPVTSRESNLLGGEGPSVTLDCLGYWHWTRAYIYSSSSTSTQNLSAKIQAVIAANPNSGLFSTDHTQLTANTTAVKQAERDHGTAEAILMQLNSLGDASNNRYNIGFYANRRLTYAVAPSSIAYQQRVTANQFITNLIQADLKPWQVNPAQWIFYPDFLVGRELPVTKATLQTDPRAGFIEAVTYRAPYDLSVNGIKLGKTDQFLARLGMGGFGG